MHHAKLKIVLSRKKPGEEVQGTDGGLPSTGSQQGSLLRSRGRRRTLRDTRGALTVVPNPTRGSMQFQFAVARAGRVRIELLDLFRRTR